MMVLGLAGSFLVVGLAACSFPEPEAGSEPTSVPSAPGAPTDRSGEVVVVQGIFDPTGEELFLLEPLKRFQWESGPTPNQTTGRFVVVVRHEDGFEVAVPFDALVAADVEGHDERHGFFEVVAPVHGVIETVEVVETATGRVFASVPASEIVPGG
jgi:hypothetical protein